MNIFWNWQEIVTCRGWKECGSADCKIWLRWGWKCGEAD